MGVRRVRGMAGRKKTERGRQKRRGRPVLEALALPEDAAGGAVRLIALGSSQLLIENHGGLAEVTDTRVRLAPPEGMLAVSGEGLRLTDVRRGALCVTGDIRQIDLPGRLGLPGRREARHD